MGIYSVGTDIIEVKRVAEAIKNYPLFASRVFTLKEREYCEKKGIVIRKFNRFRYNKEMKWWIPMLLDIFSDHWGLDLAKPCL